MKTHQVLDMLNRGETTIDCAVQLIFFCALRRYVHERAEKRPRPSHFT